VLATRQRAGDELDDVNAINAYGILIICMKMRLVMRNARFGVHANNDSLEPGNFWHRAIITSFIPFLCWLFPYSANNGQRPMTQSEIETAIPHRPPFLFIDEIVERSEARIVCRRTFREDEFFYQGHYPGRPLTPGVILCEAAMQAGAILLAQHIGDATGVPVATRMNDVKFKRMVAPGETIELDVELVERLSDAFFLKAKVSCRGKVAVRFEFACTMVAEADQV
jgi:3-hydroxyacyl-[acyl-carrier-protein] dehydratase